MRRGGRLILLLGVIIAAAAALFLYVILNGNSPVAQPTPIGPPTETPKKKIVVARADIPANSVLTDTETYLQIGDISEQEFNPQYFTSINELQGKVTDRKSTRLNSSHLGNS